MRDIACGDTLETPFLIETPFHRIRFSKERGVASIVDVKTGKELLSEGGEGAFSGIYEVTPAGEFSQCEARRRMGRNRCGIGTQRSVSRLKDSSIVESGEVSVTAKLQFDLPGTEFYDVYLKAYKNSPDIEARVCLHKQSVWDPENVYVALPFAAASENETFIDKTGCIVRPGVDQLPGTCQNFYLLQNGIVRKGEAGDLILAIKDAPLVTFGPREAGVVELCDGKNERLNRAPAYSWILNNFWETNFKAETGGFYEFTYLLRTGTTLPIEDEFRLCAALNEGLIGMYIR